jgi:hypothetical protein
MTDSRYRDTGQGRRKAARRGFSYPIKAIGLDAVQWDGFIVDISDSGAQIEFFEAPDLPPEFSLLIGGNKMVKRHCHVVWRSGDRLGVKFVRPPR